MGKRMEEAVKRYHGIQEKNLQGLIMDKRFQRLLGRSFEILGEDKKAVAVE